MRRRLMWFIIASMVVAFLILNGSPTRWTWENAFIFHVAVVDLFAVLWFFAWRNGEGDALKEGKVSLSWDDNRGWSACWEPHDPGRHTITVGGGDTATRLLSKLEDAVIKGQSNPEL